MLQFSKKKFFCMGNHTLFLGANPNGVTPNSLDNLERLFSMSAYALAHSAAKSWAKVWTDCLSKELRLEPIENGNKKLKIKMQDGAVFSFG